MTPDEIMRKNDETFATVLSEQLGPVWDDACEVVRAMGVEWTMDQGRFRDRLPENIAAMAEGALRHVWRHSQV